MLIKNELVNSDKTDIIDKNADTKETTTSNKTREHTILPGLPDKIQSYELPGKL